MLPAILLLWGTTLLHSPMVGGLPTLLPRAMDLFRSSPVPAAAAAVQHWNSSQLYDGRPVDVSFGATWAFTLNGLGVDRLDIDFAVANLTGDFPCHQCSALFISFRFEEGHIVLNSRRDGVWDFEERRVSPVTRDEKFDLVVKLVEDGFRISIDGYWHAMYYARHRASQISEINSYGEGAYVEVTYRQEEPALPSDVVDYDAEDRLAQYQATLAQYQETLSKYEEALGRALQHQETAPQATRRPESHTWSGLVGGGPVVYVEPETTQPRNHSTIQDSRAADRVYDTYDDDTHGASVDYVGSGPVVYVKPETTQRPEDHEPVVQVAPETTTQQQQEPSTAVPDSGAAEGVAEMIRRHNAIYDDDTFDEATKASKALEDYFSYDDGSVGMELALHVPLDSKRQEPQVYHSSETQESGSLAGYGPVVQFSEAQLEALRKA